MNVKSYWEAVNCRVQHVTVNNTFTSKWLTITQATRTSLTRPNLAAIFAAISNRPCKLLAIPR